jgi:hypothetical protein
VNAPLKGERGGIETGRVLPHLHYELAGIVTKTQVAACRHISFCDVYTLLVINASVLSLQKLTSKISSSSIHTPQPIMNAAPVYSYMACYHSDRRTGWGPLQIVSRAAGACNTRKKHQSIVYKIRMLTFWRSIFSDYT